MRQRPRPGENRAFVEKADGICWGEPRCTSAQWLLEQARADRYSAAVASGPRIPDPFKDDLPAARLTLWLLALGAVGAYERLLVPGPPHALALSDAYYYGRLAWLSRLAFPRPVTFDSYVAFPGMEVPWPPGHAWLLAALQAAFGAQSPFSEDGLAALAWAGPIIGLAGIGALAGLAAAWFGRWAALVVSGAFLVQPLLAAAGQLGEADHHLHEAFFAAAVALVLARALGPRAPAVRGGIALGAIAGLPYLFTLSGFLYLPPIVASSLLAHVFRGRGRWRRATALAFASLSSLVVVALGAAAVGRLGRSDYVRLSGFHVAAHALLLAAASAPLALAPIRRLRAAGWCGLVLGLGGFAVFARAVLGEVARGLSHLGRESPILSEALESYPLFRGGLSGEAVSLAATAIVAAPIAAAAGILLARRQRSRAPAWLVPLAGWVALLSAIAAAQVRFARPMVGACAVLVGLMVQAAARNGLEGAPKIAARLAALFLVLPPPAAFAPFAEDDVQFLEGLEPALAYLRLQTPEPGGLYLPGQRPAWGVLADWNLGHLISALGERPVAASPFGQVAEAEGAVAFVRAQLASEDPAQAARACLEKGLRYALVYQRLPKPGEQPRTLRDRLASGAVAPGFRPVFAWPSAGDRVARVFEIVDPGGEVGGAR